MVDLVQQLQIGFENRSILIVDDDVDLTESLSRILRMFFKECVIATDGLTGYETYLKRFNDGNEFTLVLTDLELPKKGGFSLISDIKKLNEQQQIIILSAHNESSFMAEAINYNIQGYLLKPLAMPKLFSSLKKVFISSGVTKESIKIADSIELKPLTALTHLLENAHDEPLTILAIRINHLSNICNLIGEDYASEYFDELFCTLGRLTISKDGVFYRYSKDILCLVFHGELGEYAKKLAEDMISIVRHLSISSRGIVLNSTLSVAITVNDSTPISHLKQTLDTLKKISVGEVAMYEPSKTQAQPAYGRKILELIFQALENGAIVPLFQPVADVKTSDIKLYAALMRIRANGKLYEPSSFLQIAIGARQITMLTRAMVHAVLMRRKLLGEDAIVSINLSFDDLCDDTFALFVTFCLNKYGISADKLAFEIAGDAVKFDTEYALPVIKQLKLLGCKIIINDFGAKESKVLALFDIEPDYIKLHGSIVEKIEDEPRFLPVAQKLVEIIHSVGAKAIAKHLATDRLACVAKDIGVDYLQGYAIGELVEI